MIIRSLFFIFLFVPFLIIAIPTQAVIIALKLPFWHIVPRLFHKVGCAFLGLRITVIGAPATGRPTLLAANHTSWIDIVAIGSAADVAFVAKNEIARWPFVSMMANLQKTIYVDRTRRAGTGKTAEAMGKLMADGTAVVLFAEGQSNLGPHLLPFRSALIGAAQHAMEEAGAKEVNIQPLSIAYTRLQGLPVGRNERGHIAWSKSKSLKQNVREILGGSVKDVTIVFGTPHLLGQGADRKAVSRTTEAEVRNTLVALNRGGKLPAQAA